MDNEMVVFDAYHKWMGIPAAEQPADFYRLLGLARFESDPDVIDAAANKQMAYLRGCAKGDHADQAEEMLNEVARARLCLLSERKKSVYDADLKRRVQAPVLPHRSPVSLNAPPVSQRAGGNADQASDWWSPSALPTLPGDAIGRVRSVWIWFSLGALTGTLITVALVSNPGDPDRRPVDQPASADSHADDLLPQFTNSIEMKMMLIPAGDFMMGSSENSGYADEQPQHLVSISKRFYMGCFEVTQGQYQVVMGENPSELVDADKPVDRVSWLKATEFCRKLSDKETALYRLPTEAEWEYACRAGTTGHNHFSGSPADYAHYDRTSDHFVRQGGRLKPNAFGLFDMNGNVKEWCHDHYGRSFYETSTHVVDPIGPLGTSYLPSRVMRGGSCEDVIEMCNNTYRFSELTYTRSRKNGFRVIKVIDGRPDDYDDWAGMTRDREGGQSPR
jgi:formylglycine-generating enzyme required for sulfatase activity